jgi:secreted Zn-dependent insulinase-like peptidase
LDLPEKNPLIPTDFTILNDKYDNKYPIKLLNTPECEVNYKFDDKFKKGDVIVKAHI